jgi:hypothetical protein
MSVPAPVFARGGGLQGPSDHWNDTRMYDDMVNRIRSEVR